MKYVSPLNTFNTLINGLMGTGPLVLPPANSGFSLSLIALFFMLFISVICAEYNIEVIMKIKLVFRNSKCYGFRKWIRNINVEHWIRTDLVIIKLREIWF